MTGQGLGREGAGGRGEGRGAVGRDEIKESETSYPRNRVRSLVP